MVDTFPRGGCTSKKNCPCMYQLACLPKWVSSQLYMQMKSGHHKNIRREVGIIFITYIETMYGTYSGHIDTYSASLTRRGGAQ